MTSQKEEIVCIYTASMVFWGVIKPKRRAYATFLAREKNISVKRIMQECSISRASVYRLRKEQYNSKNINDSKNLGRRPRKLSDRDERKLMRALTRLRHKEGNFSSFWIMETAGIQLGSVSNRTIRHVLGTTGVFYLQARKKGLVTEKDLALRIKFAKYMQREYPKDVWQNKIAFYLDGVSFYHKINPTDQARAPQGRIWRKKCEGLNRGCTGKGAKVGSGGRVMKLIVAISYGKGVIQCTQYEHMNGEFFASFVENNLDAMFMRAGKGISRLWIQDGDPSQNCAAV